MSDGLALAERKMRDEGLADATIEAFRGLFGKFTSGDTGELSDADLDPVEDLPELGGLGDGDGGVLDRVVAIKLNGGLGTSMGMTGPKSLVPVKDGLTFLDITARQLLLLRERHGARLPLVLMNSWTTRDPSLAALERHPELTQDLPRDFLQSRLPKVLAEELRPVEWPENPELEWAPPGHGDLYAALRGSGVLDAMLEQGYEYAFVSNFDNLGATVDPAIPEWLDAERIPFLMEVCRRTGADRKGGHLAVRGDGRLTLRELAQTPEADAESFQDIDRWRYFNTNSLWLHLPSLASAGAIELPLIVNAKTVDPSDAGSPRVVQLETAMGAAISSFEGARAVCVPRTRFAPVKTTNDLFVLRSDAYRLTDEFHLELVGERGGEATLVDLDPDYFKLLPDFDARLPAGPPSLKGCSRFVVRGDFRFGADIVAGETVELRNDGEDQISLPDGSTL